MRVVKITHCVFNLKQLLEIKSISMAVLYCLSLKVKATKYYYALFKHSLEHRMKLHL